MNKNDKENNDIGETINNIGMTIIFIMGVILTVILVVGMKQTDTDNIVFLILAIAPLAMVLKVGVMVLSNELNERRKTKLAAKHVEQNRKNMKGE